MSSKLRHKDYYVYAHYLDGESSPFYIGSGRGTRAWANGKRRNPVWNEVVSGKSYKVVMLMTNLTKVEALNEELRLQKLHSPVACLMYGREFSESTRAKMSRSRRSNMARTKELTGYSLPESTRLKMGQLRAGAGNPRARAVINCRGEVFSTVKEAAEAFGIKSRSHISSVCKGNRNYCGKYLDNTPIKWYYYKQDCN